MAIVNRRHCLEEMDIRGDMCYLPAEFTLNYSVPSKSESDHSFGLYAAQESKQNNTRSICSDLKTSNEVLAAPPSQIEIFILEDSDLSFRYPFASVRLIISPIAPEIRFSG